jgi:MOSC domain-containing protein YiiM
MTPRGRITGLQRSGGGVPKLPVDHVHVNHDGMEGDRQRNLKHHGGPERALCLYSQELIDDLAMEGHPIVPGAVGENVTISGLDWREVQPGARIRLGAVTGVVTAFAIPCNTIREAFLDERSVRISEKVHPGWSRVYLRVEQPGEIAVGDPVEILR